MTITPEQLNEWKRLAEQATKGPWVVANIDRFITASREAVPALIAEVEAREKELRAKEAAWDRCINFRLDLQDRVRSLEAEVERLTQERDKANVVDCGSLMCPAEVLEWNPANHLYGAARTPAQAARIRDEDATRIDRQGTWPKWRDIEHDDTRGRALPEHMEAAVKNGGAK